VIAINESHLKRLLSAYVKYYHQDRTHCGLERQAPETRTRCSGRGKVVAWPVSEAFTIVTNAPHESDAGFARLITSSCAHTVLIACVADVSLCD
jgi:hypothetical protein